MKKRKRRSQCFISRKKPRTVDLPNELWLNIVSRIRDHKSLITVACVRKEHFLHIWAMHCIRVRKIDLVQEALKEVTFTPAIKFWNAKHTDMTTVWHAQATRLASLLVDAFGTTLLPKIMCKFLKHHVSFFSTGNPQVDKRSGNWFILGHGEGMKGWFLRAAFRPCDPNTSPHPHEVLLWQDQCYLNGHKIGHHLRRFFKKLRFRVTLACKRGDHTWTEDDISDTDYMPRKEEVRMMYFSKKNVI